MDFQACTARERQRQDSNLFAPKFVLSHCNVLPFQRAQIATCKSIKILNLYEPYFSVFSETQERSAFFPHIPNSLNCPFCLPVTRASHSHCKLFYKMKGYFKKLLWAMYSELTEENLKSVKV